MEVHRLIFQRGLRVRPVAEFAPLTRNPVDPPTAPRAVEYERHQQVPGGMHRSQESGGLDSSHTRRRNLPAVHWGRQAVRRMLIVWLVTPALFLVTPAIPAQAISNGLFWLQCGYSHSLPDDPIIGPGLPGTAHLHDFFGNVTANASSTYDAMLMGMTTCHLTEDTGAYWFPALLDSSATPVPPLWVSVYYWGMTGVTQSFPPDFKEVAGATTGTAMGHHVYYQCMGRNSTKYLSLPNCAATTGKFVKGQVEFRSCWDGVVALNETPHMRYPNGDTCPASFHTHLPRLVLHAVWPVVDASQDSLASDSGMRAFHGKSLHADFWNTWQQEKLDALVADCIDTGISCRRLQDT